MDKADMAQGKIILGKGLSYSMDCHRTGLNNNVLIVGASGSGKTRGIICPNITQAYGSYVISDPKGTLYSRYRDYLESSGYRVMCLDFIHPDASKAHYNFFRYIRDEQDIVRIAYMMAAGQAAAQSRADPFWDQSAGLLLSAAIALLKEGYPSQDQTLANIMKVLSQCRAPENDADETTPADLLFARLGERMPGSFAVRQYGKFRLAAGRTLRSILVTLAAKLWAFDTHGLHGMTAYDDLELWKIGMQKTALFVIVSDMDRSMDVLANIFFTQAMQELCICADGQPEGSLPVPVRFILDDFATTVRIEGFPRMISTIRSRNISAMLAVQAFSQLLDGYGMDGRTIIANCDTIAYLGGNDIATAEDIVKRTGLPLKEVLEMPAGSGWVFRRGQEPEVIHL